MEVRKDLLKLTQIIILKKNYVQLQKIMQQNLQKKVF